MNATDGVTRAKISAAVSGAGVGDAVGVAVEVGVGVTVEVGVGVADGDGVGLGVLVVVADGVCCVAEEAGVAAAESVPFCWHAAAIMNVAARTAPRSIGSGLN